VSEGAVGRRRRQGWAALCASAILFTLGVGLDQSQAIRQFRDPPVTATLTTGERQVVDGVAYQLTSLIHARALPADEGSRDRYPGGMVSAMAGAELVLVVLTVERLDPARDPEMVFCTVTLEDSAGRRWVTDGTVDYVVARPPSVSCIGNTEDSPKLGEPFEVGWVYQVPADVVGDLRVRARLSGGDGTHLLEFDPR
jgi:hypothetical protein